MLKHVREFVAGYEVVECPPWLREEAILASDDAHWVMGESLRAAGGVRGVGY